MTMITPSYLGETIEYSSLHACRSTLEDPTSVLPPLISQGLLLDRIAVANWTSLRRVIAKKTFLFLKPDKKAKSRTYVVMGDLVGVFSQSGDWLRVEYVNGQKRVGGWIRAADAVELQPPR